MKDEQEGPGLSFFILHPSSFILPEVWSPLAGRTARLRLPGDAPAWGAGSVLPIPGERGGRRTLTGRVSCRGAHRRPARRERIGPCAEGRQVAFSGFGVSSGAPAPVLSWRLLLMAMSWLTRLLKSKYR